MINQGRFREACHYPCSHRRDEPATHPICPVCYLFGAQGLVGFVSVPFLFAKADTDKSDCEELYAARIDRVTRTVRTGTNRSYQHVPPRAEFEGRLTVTISDDLLGWRFGARRTLNEKTEGDAWISSDWTGDKILNELLIERLKAIRSIGGYRSKGFGGVRIEVIPLDTPKK